MLLVLRPILYLLTRPRAEVVVEEGWRIFSVLLHDTGDVERYSPTIFRNPELELS
jgi:hypothetical protein